MQRVTIIGLGLIGGSIGLGLRRWSQNQGKGGSTLQITGFDLNLEHQHYAKKIQAVDRTEWELAKSVRDADIVILATPVTAIRELMSDIAPVLQSGTIVTDVGSTKADVLRWANELLPRTVSFVGGHPMAGKSQSIEGADADLFKGATWCVCPSVHANEEAIRNVLGMISALDAESFFIDPVEHDAFVAGVSHLPFILSAALMSSTSSDSSWRDMKTLSATGFRDVTRLAAGSAAMHRDIVLTNREAIDRWVGAMIDELGKVRAMMSGDEASDELLRYFDAARDARADWSTQTRREGELLQSTEEELTSVGLSGQMGRLFFGNLLGRRRGSIERLTQHDKAGVNGDRDRPRS